MPIDLFGGLPFLEVEIFGEVVGDFEAGPADFFGVFADIGEFYQ